MPRAHSLPAIVSGGCWRLEALLYRGQNTPLETECFSGALASCIAGLSEEWGVKLWSPRDLALEALCEQWLPMSSPVWQIVFSKNSHSNFQFYVYF